MKRKTAALTAAVSAVVALTAITTAEFLPGSGQSTTPTAEPTATDGAPPPTQQTEQGPKPQEPSKDPLLQYVPTAFGVTADDCQDVAPDAELSCTLPIQENSPERTLRVWRVDPTDEAAVLSLLCAPWPQDCEPEPLPKPIGGKWISQNAPGPAEIRWTYTDRPVVLAIAADEGRQDLENWWKGLDLSPGA